MVVYLDLDNENYVVGHGSDDGDAKIDLPKDHKFFDSVVEAWKYVDGELVYDAERAQEITERREENQLSDVERLEKAIMELAKISLN